MAERKTRLLIVDGGYLSHTPPSMLPSDMDARRNRMNRDANVVVAFPDRMVLIAMRDGSRDDPAEVHPDSSMEMLVYYLRNNSEKIPAIRVGSKAAPRIEELAYAF